MRTDTPPRRVVLTGLGSVNAAGADVAGSWARVRAGTSCLSSISRFDTAGYPIRVAGEMPAFDPAVGVPRRFLAKTDRFTHLAFAAVDEALRDGKLDLAATDRSRVGVWFGNNTGGWDLCERGFREYYGNGPDTVNPWQATAWFLAAPQGFLTIRHGLRGMSKSFSGDRASGAATLYHAMRAISRGRVDTVIAGGCEAPLSPLSLLCFHSNGELSERGDPATAYRPYDVDASGTVLGEGAAAVLLEDEDAVLRRGGRVHAVVLGGAHGTAPAEQVCGYGDVLRRALADAGCGPGDIDLVIGDGAGQYDADQIEAAAVAAAFAGRGEPVPLATPKAVYGHLYGAAFCADVICGALAARDSVVPGTAGFRNGLLPEGVTVTGTERAAPVRRFMVCTRSRYGSCVAMVFAAPGTA
ncbi:MAG: beta-ketoacyl-[acyl-carrier-protein] synthase family protein [Pseudonocardiaceae bacterium]